MGGAIAAFFETIAAESLNRSLSGRQLRRSARTASVLVSWRVIEYRLPIADVNCALLIQTEPGGKMPTTRGTLNPTRYQFTNRSEVFDLSFKVFHELMARKVNQDILGVVENMSWFTGDDGKQYAIFGEGGGEALATELEVPLLGRIPLVPELRFGPIGPGLSPLPEWCGLPGSRNHPG